MIPQQRQPLIDTFIHRNSQINLSAIRTPEAIYVKHILDSLEITKIMDLEGGTLLDLGTGGGFPLLPLAMTYPDIECIGLDTRKKKCTAIEAMVQELGLENVRTHRGRAEESNFQVDILTSRAVSFADQLLQRSLPLVKPGGTLIFYKLFTSEEDNALLSLITRHDLTLTHLHHYHLPDDEVERVLYVIRK